MTEKSSFRTKLEAAANRRHSSVHPFTEKWERGELSREQLAGWASQHYQYVSQFSRWCAAVYAECPHEDARDFLLENIIEEDSGTKHVELLIRFALACGVSRSEVVNARQLPATRGLTAWCHEAAHRPFHEAAAGLLVGLESQVPAISRRQLAPLKDPYGFNDHEVEFFAVHIEADQVHGERGYQLVDKHCTTPEMQAQALEAVRQATEMRWQYMTGLYRVYILKEEL